MMGRFRMNTKLATGAIATAMFLLTACGAGSDEEVTSVSIQKDGTVLSHIVEEFEQSYYDQEELQQAILKEAAEYNKAAGNGRINVEKINVDGGVATVRMIYQNAGDYAGFNHVVFFAGTASDAQEEHELNVVLSGVKDTNDTLSKADILAMEGYKILITDIKEPVYLDGRAEYISDNVTAANDRKSVWISGAGQGYVLYK